MERKNQYFKRTVKNSPQIQNSIYLFENDFIVFEIGQRKLPDIKLKIEGMKTSKHFQTIVIKIHLKCFCVGLDQNGLGSVCTGNGHES